MALDRRHALLGGGALATGGWGVFGEAKAAAIPGRIVGADFATGHRLRGGALPEPSSSSETGVLIVGGGIAGLSAAWRLQRQSVTDFSVVELEREVGGNAASGQNAVSAYPWGAHYVPLLTREATHAAELFEDFGIITGRTPDGEPIYNEYYLCADPRERLFMLGRWQEDILPTIGITAEDRRQYRSFFAAMAAYRTMRGADGRKAFAIPLDLSSADPALRALDQTSMAEWMHGRGWTSAPLAWYVEYCCRDDYGTRPDEVSAWAGIHYFAARDGRGGDDDTQSVLTWPQGNGWIVGQLKQRLASHLDCAALAWRVRQQGERVAVDVFDPAANTTRRIVAKAVVLATPRFIADHLLGRAPDTAHSYAPWMVANVTVQRMPAGRGMPLCWDNVFYDSRSLGYVVATHQGLERARSQTVLTHYWPLSDLPPAQARQQAVDRSLAEWQAMVQTDLLRAHPELEGQISNIDVWLWGHGMIRPIPGFLWGEARAAACVQTPPIFAAHSDMSGISIFEEANYRGVVAADAVMAYLGA
jgi:monoamine oxidase